MYSDESYYAAEYDFVEEKKKTKIDKFARLKKKLGLSSKSASLRSSGKQNEGKRAIINYNGNSSQI